MATIASTIRRAIADDSRGSPRSGSARVTVRSVPAPRNASHPTSAVKPVVIRMPVDLHDAIKRKAAAEERSMAQAIRHALRIYTEASA